MLGSLQHLNVIIWDIEESRTLSQTLYGLIYLRLEQISRKWKMPIKNWKAAL
jgi:hypothetical protein